jgi:hypothetical protein
MSKKSNTKYMHLFTAKSWHRVVHKLKQDDINACRVYILSVYISREIHGT